MNRTKKLLVTIDYLGCVNVYVTYMITGQFADKPTRGQLTDSEF